MHFDEHFLKEALSDISLLHKTFPKTFPKDVSFSVDSRTLQKGDIFVALKGTHFDGHDAILEVLEKGASGLLLKEEKKGILKKIDAALLKNKLVVLVKDTLSTFVQLATAWRAQFDYPVVAITGSIGKTSTKEMVSNILDVAGVQYVSSYGNQNTLIGLSLNIFKMRDFHKAAIFELGIAKRGEMDKLVELVNPTISVITSVGHSHMEGLGSLADIADEKRKVFKLFTEERIGIINGDQPILAKVGYPHPVIKFGSKTTNQIQARKIHLGNGYISFLLKMYKNKYNVVLKHAHSGMVFNALAASAVAHLLGVSPDHIVKGIEVPLLIESRFERRLLSKKRGVLISDCYNASPESMKEALSALEYIDTTDQKIVVLGDMLELGVNSPFWHRQLGRFLRKVSTLKHVILVGNMVEWTKKTIPIGVTVDHVSTWQEAASKLEEKIAKKKSLVLVKGSLGMNLRDLVEHFSEKQA